MQSEVYKLNNLFRVEWAEMMIMHTKRRERGRKEKQPLSASYLHIRIKKTAEKNQGRQTAS
jgi:hypothetical protein